MMMDEKLVAEDMTQDDEIGLTVVEKPKSEFVRPAYTFKGVELFPFTYGYEILFNQVRDAEDTGLYTWMSFVFMLRKRNESEEWKEHRNWVRSMAWKVELFRDALLDWMDENGPFTVEDKIEAKKIYEENMKAAADATVEAVPDRGRKPQKKTVRRKKPLSSTSSEGN